MPTLHIHLLGDFRLLYGEAPVRTINAPRLHALLAYLLLHRDAPQPRHHLAFVLWSDTTEAQARTNLRQLLHDLKQALPAADLFVHTDAKTLQWRPDASFRLDVAEFEQALTGADVAEQEQQKDMRSLHERRWSRPSPSTTGTCCPVATTTGSCPNASACVRRLPRRWNA